VTIRLEKDIVDFYDEVAFFYDTSHHPSRPGIDVERRIVKKKIASLSERISNALDLGSGTACWTEALYENQKLFCNLDVSRNMITASQIKLLKILGNNCNVSFFRGDMRYTPFRDETFDLVLCMYSLGHVKDRKKVICEMKRVLRRGKCCVIAVDGPWFNISKRISPTKLHDFHNVLASKGCDKINKETLGNGKVFSIYVHHYSFNELQFDVSSAGFQIEDIFGCMVPFTFLPYEILKKLKKCEGFFENKFVLKVDELLGKYRLFIDLSPHIFCVARKKA